MEILCLKKELEQNSYPGRGIVIGKSEDGRHGVIAYFIMGRSENSRNRVFVEEGDGLRTEAFDPAKLVDPSLIIYSPVRVLGGVTIVTNGDQTDTVYDFMKAGKSFAAGLRTRTFEPDGPNWTPRISGLLEKDGGYRLSILKSADGNAEGCRRYFYEYENPLPGEGHFIHTYRENGDPIPSFEGEPKKVKIAGDLDSFTEMVWNALNADNKVSLFTRFVELSTGRAETRVVNKNK
ncbi:MAG: IMP cyclohydrolase [Oscillospiraceae bacterium]|nr:IMP cyclohydrolase [Oscillospiraceae bacterium]